jgi:hypothetical protein
VTITSTEIAVALGRPIPDIGSTEDQQWSMWISDALMLIQRRHTDLGLLDQDVLDYVVREAVVAQVRRPDDATSVDVRVDDGAVSRTYRSSAGRVTIRDEWWDLLDPDSGRGGAFSIRPYGSGSCHADICSANTYVDTNGAIMFGGAYCSCGADIAGYPLYEVDGY